MAIATEKPKNDENFVRGFGVLDATMIVAGSMIGSGIFIVPGEISRQVGAPGWLLVVWLVTGILTVVGALSYGELAGMLPKAGGQYVYLREAYSPLWGFLYGWTFFLVIETGTIAAVAIGFAKYLGVLVPDISETRYLITPVAIGTRYAISLSTTQAVGILLIVLQTWMNTRGLELGKLVQNVFTITKTGVLLALIVAGIVLGLGVTSGAVRDNFGRFWEIRGDLQGVGAGLTAMTGFGLFVGICVAQTNSLFSADSWHSIAFIAGEVKEPRKTIPLALFLGASGVIGLYLLANVAYLAVLPLETIQTTPNDRVASAVANVAFPRLGATIMAIAIMISTFGCNNGIILSGARLLCHRARRPLFQGSGATQFQTCSGAGLGYSRRLGGALGLAESRQSRRRDRENNVWESLHKFTHLRYFRRLDLLYPDDPRHLSSSNHSTGGRATVSRLGLSDSPGDLHSRGLNDPGRALHVSRFDELAGPGHRGIGLAGLLHLARRLEAIDDRRAAGRFVPFESLGALALRGFGVFLVAESLQDFEDFAPSGEHPAAVFAVFSHRFHEFEFVARRLLRTAVGFFLMGRFRHRIGSSPGSRRGLRRPRS